LNGTTIDFYDKKGGKLKGSFNVDRGCDVVDKGKSSGKFIFMIKPKNTRKEHYFRADDEKSSKDWMTSFDRSGKLAEAQMSRLLKVWSEQNDECVNCYAASVMGPTPELTTEEKEKEEKEEKEKEKEEESPADEWAKICSLNMQTIDASEVNFKYIFKTKIICVALLRHFG